MSMHSGFSVSISPLLKSKLPRTLNSAEKSQMYSKLDSMTLVETMLAIIVSLITVITSTALGVRWLTKHYFDEIKHEMKPNGGSSLKDQVNRMESDILDLKNQNLKGEEYHEKLDNKIDELTRMFVEYVSRQK